MYRTVLYPFMVACCLVNVQESSLSSFRICQCEFIIIIIIYECLVKTLPLMIVVDEAGRQLV